ncbi:hypothetical protein [Paenibacillus harenae]|nr:hypothetical protein [Paenibacillus harenae]MDQ0062884.1 spore coat protein CotF [Paenibacillus harenae]
MPSELDEMIDAHERIMSYMIERGWYHLWHPIEQIQLDLQYKLL